MLLQTPVSELLQYKGVSPCPSDIDVFWDEGLAEIAFADDKLTMTKSTSFSAPNVDCFDCFFTGCGGSRVYFKYVRPIGKENCKIILNFHGYTCNCGEWVDMLPYAYAGFAVASLDCRGQGGISEDKGIVTGNTHNGHIIRGLIEYDPKKLYYRNVFLDTAQLAKIVGGFAETNEHYIIAKGWSQGGALALACAALVENVKECYPVYPFLCDFKAAIENIETNEAFSEIIDFIRCNDPLHKNEDKILKTLSYIDVANIMGRINSKVIFTVALNDKVCCATNQFAAYNRIKSEKELITYKFYGHESLQNHNDLLWNYILRNA